MAAHKMLLCVLMSLFVLTTAQECGKFTGNIDDKDSKLPWMVQLRERMSSDVICTGTLISNRHVLIDAHCVWPKSYFVALKLISNVYVTIGNDAFDLMDIKINSDWKFNNPNYDGDIAIAVLFNPVTFSDTVQPICLPEQNAGTLIRPDGLVTGINNIDNTNVRRRVTVEKNDVCFQHFPTRVQKASPRTFCVKWQGEDLEIANGFSGSYLHNSDDVWLIQGIETETFVQKNDCDIQKHSIFTNVAHYIDWIQNIVKRDTEQVWKDIELKCTFKRNFEGLYGCEVENLIINSPNVRIASISGLHEDNMDNSAVEYVWIKDSQTSHLPRFDAGIFFPHLIKYLITNSGLKFISRDDFSGMPKLETLDLSHNELKEIPEDTLYDLNELVDLYIENNQFKNLPENLLSHAPAFQRFKATNNTLEILPANFFKANHALKILSLDNNKLHKIFVDFRPFRNLKKIDLLNNRCISTNFNDWRRYKSVLIVQKEIESACV
ncbi:CLUMA_CG009794, isoform A [Clunio marinus]|uniref:CLUMA_CG009794, isoform A n=1 Tax=Clunio marinus TaxID=568069 RepID=A0A1J1ID54_9DIPT|nr:CLUMA_CG009794, isoform A [Clunio marinus]